MCSFYCFNLVKYRNENIIPQTFKRFLYKNLLNYNIINEVLIKFIVMKLKVLIPALLIMFSCVDKDKKVKKNIDSAIVEVSNSVNDIELEVYDYAGLEKFLNMKDDKVYVINFWATWCGPCVKELPHFEKLYETYSNENVEVILVSLDFPRLYETKLKPYILENKLKSRVIALDDVDVNSWIPKVDKSWSGAIPATIIYRNNERKFYEKSFTYNELENELKQFLN
jgi:thiol-disulfide isomerase/thioredoxin